MNSSFDEKDAIRRSLGGDREAFRPVVEAYQGRIFRLVHQIVQSREDAQDIVQEAFVKAYLSLNTFKQESSLYTWLYRIAYNMAVDFKRRVTRRGGIPVELDEVHRSVKPAVENTMGGPHDEIYRKEQGALIQRVLSELTDEHRAVITLREIDGLSYEDIASVTGVTKGTVMSRLHYARKKMQEALKEIAPEGAHTAEREGESDGNGENRAGNVKENTKEKGGSGVHYVARVR